MKDTIKLLKECNSGCKTAINGMNQVKDRVSSSDLRETIDRCSKFHLDLGNRCHTMLNALGENDCDPPEIGMAFSRIGTELKLAVNDTDKHIAEMMADGASMGMKSIAKVMNSCPDASNESRTLASDIIKEEEGFFSNMLRYI